MKRVKIKEQNKEPHKIRVHEWAESHMGEYLNMRIIVREALRNKSETSGLDPSLLSEAALALVMSIHSENISSDGLYINNILDAVTSVEPRVKEIVKALSKNDFSHEENAK